MWVALASYAVATAMFGFGVTFFKDTLIRRALLVSTCGLGAQVVSLGVRWARVGHGPYLGFYEVANALVLCAVAFFVIVAWRCLLYTSDAADEEDSVDLGGRRIIKKKTTTTRSVTRIHE